MNNFLLQNRDSIQIVLQIIGVIAPSLIAALALGRRTFLKKQFTDLSKKVQDGFDNNQKQHKELNQKVEEHQILLIQYKQTIEQYLQEKSIASRFRQVAKHAIQFCRNKCSAKIIDNITEHFILFVQSIIDVGFQNTNREQIAARLSTQGERTRKFTLSIMSKQ